MLAPTDPDLRRELERLLAPERVLTEPIQRVAFASDASFYRLIPQAVVQPTCVAEIQALFRLGANRRIPLTVRAGGTSLSGQAVSDGILVDVARHWRQVAVLDGGARVRVQPGVIGATVNALLRPHGAKMGPDPASIASCMMGGILANNSSGMCCGVAQNSYHTLESLTFVLPNGLAIDSAAPDADARLHAGAPELAAGLLRLKQRIESEPALVARIRAKYRAKNTTGYALNAFLDHQRAVDIFRHLLIGSEGTLAFIAEAVLRTVPDLPAKRTGMLYFATIQAAADAIAPLAAAGAAAIEIMDRAALRSVEAQAGAPALLMTLGADAAALLVEFHGHDAASADALLAQARPALFDLALTHPVAFTADPYQQAALWKIRKGMFPSVGAVRARGTSVILEDVAFPIARMAEAITDLHALFRRHGYADAIIFGHAKDGNLHFVVSQGFADPADIERYRAFIAELVELVVGRYDGVLKAEHGTGRNMAPFVEAEWGADLYAVMREAKQLADPEGILNPGVVINPHADAHLRDLKPLPVVEDEVDKCIECGYCEAKCPSRDLTLTPRQRIVVRREQARLRDTGGDPALLAALDDRYGWMALDTCATDGLCATACPVDIDTGKLVKRLRHEALTPFARGVASRLARSFRTVEAGSKLALTLARGVAAVIGTRGMDALAGAVRDASGAPVPGWHPRMPASAPAMPTTDAASASAVYVPACLTRTFASHGERPLPEVLVELARRAGQSVHIPADIAGACCGMPFGSKGYHEAHAIAAEDFVERLWRWSDAGRLPVVIDTTACTQTVRDPSLLSPLSRERLAKVTVLDAIEYVHDRLLPALTPTKQTGAVALHPTCSAVKLGLADKLTRIAGACSERADVPLAYGCCGFAGDRGLLVPELTASATALEAAEIRAGSHVGHYSCGRTCELGMEEATGKAYTSFLYLVERATRPVG